MTSPPGMTVGAVARQLGVAVTTLRTWHQRYGLGPNPHRSGQHRRYDPEDVARLTLMQRLVVDGVPPGEAARWASRRPLPELNGASHPPPNVQRRTGGGLAIGRADPAAGGICRAALRLDSGTVKERLGEVIGRLGVIGAWDTVVRPVLRGLGNRYSTSGTLIEVEHLVSHCVSGALATTSPPGPTRSLLACTEGEHHSLPIEALDAALAERGTASRLLGANVPTAALLAAIRRTGPAAVLVWAQRPETADPEQLSALLRSRPRPLVIAAAGPGWDPATLPAGVAAPDSLAGAAALLATAD